MKTSTAASYKSYLPFGTANIIIFIWIVFVIISYFSRFIIKFEWLPNIFPTQTFTFTHFVSAWLMFTFFVFCIGLVNICAYTIGRQALKLFNIELTRYAKHIFSICLGLGTISYTVFFLGSIGLLYKQLLWLIPAAGLCILLVHIKNAKRILPIPKSGVPSPKWNYYWFFVIGMFVSLSFLGCLLPETFYDSLNHHLAAPNQYLIRHNNAPLQNNLYTFIPANIEMLFTAGLSLGGDIAAKLINFSILLWLLYFIYGFIKTETGENEAPLFGIVIFISLPLVLISSWKTQIEFGLSLFSAAALISFIEFFKEENYLVKQKYLILCGIFLGFTMGSKYTGVLNALALGIILIFSSYKQPKILLKRIFIIISISSILVAPWLIRNYIYTKNPVYPLFSAHIGIKENLDNNRYKLFMIDVKHRRLKPAIMHNIISFWTLTMQGFHDNDFIGVIYLLLIVLLFLFINITRTVKVSLAYCVLLYVFWIINSHMLRFFIPGLLILSIILSIYLFNGKISPATRIIVKTAVAVIVWAHFFWIILAFKGRNPFNYLWGAESKVQYISQKYKNHPNPSYKAMEFINTRTDTNARILFVGDVRTFNINRYAIASSVFDTNPFFTLAKQSQTGENLMQKLREKGITHLLLNMGELMRTKELGILDWNEQSKK
ncbi:MAG: glycosyltransferase family 39 protein [bacterium]